MSDDPWKVAAVQMARAPGSTAATYQSVDGGPHFPLRLILSEPEDSFGAGRGRSAIAVVATIAALDMGPTLRPQRGDLIGVDDQGKGWKVEDVKQDTTGASWQLGLRRQD